MNSLETAYAEVLRARQLAGEVDRFFFESVKLRLADKTFYTPDFMVMLAGGEIEIHEVKGGFIEDDAIVKLKVAAEMFPFKFILCQKKNKKSDWVFTEK